MKKLKLLIVFSLLSSFLLTGCIKNEKIENSTLAICLGNILGKQSEYGYENTENLYLPLRNEEFQLNCMAVYNKEKPKENLTKAQANELMNSIVVAGYKIDLPILVSDLPEEIEVREATSTSIFEEEPDYTDLMLRPVTLIFKHGEYTSEVSAYAIHSEDYNEDVIVRIELSILNNVGKLKSYIDNYEFGKLPTEFVEKYGKGEIIPRAYVGKYTYRRYSDGEKTITFLYRGTTDPEEDDKIEKMIDASAPMFVYISYDSYADMMDNLFKER